LVDGGGAESLPEQVRGDSIFVDVGFRLAAVGADVPAGVGGDGEGRCEDCECREAQRR
jgi:hypothetical protein